MQLHQLTTRKEKSQRIARGGKRGTTSGRGQKGQRSRAGHKIRPALRDLIARLPKKRGFKNRPKSLKPVAVNLSAIERHLAKKGSSAVVTLESLRAAGAVPQRYAGGVKLLASGTLKTAITVKGLPVSAAAKEKIEKAGGSVEA